MKRRLVLLILLAAWPAAAQTDEVVRAALYLTGADSPEALDDRSWMSWRLSGAVLCPLITPRVPVCWRAVC